MNLVASFCYGSLSSLLFGVVLHLCDQHRHIFCLSRSTIDIQMERSCSIYVYIIYHGNMTIPLYITQDLGLLSCKNNANNKEYIGASSWMQIQFCYIDIWLKKRIKLNGEFDGIKMYAIIFLLLLQLICKFAEILEIILKIRTWWWSKQFDWIHAKREIEFQPPIPRLTSRTIEISNLCNLRLLQIPVNLHSWF